MTATDREVSEKLRSIIRTGTLLAGGATANAIGFLAAGPAGAAILGAIGTAASEALVHVGEEIANRLLGPREKARVGAVVALTAERIRQRTEAGDKPRSDGFFDERSEGRSDAEAVAEDIISKAQRESEEKKLPYLASMLANIAYDDGVSSQFAHQLAKISGDLTYRQLVILALASRAKLLNLHPGDYRHVGQFGRNLYQVLHEILEMERRGLLGNGGHAVLGLTDIRPSELTVQGAGADLYNLMELHRIPIQETDQLAKDLRTDRIIEDRIISSTKLGDLIVDKL